MVFYCEQSSRACQHWHNFYISDVMISPMSMSTTSSVRQVKKKIALGMQSMHSCSYTFSNMISTQIKLKMSNKTDKIQCIK